MVTSISSCQILSLYGKQPIYSESSGQHEPPQQISSSKKFVIICQISLILVCLNHCQDKRVQNILVADHYRPWPECDHRWRCTHSKSSSHSRPHWLEYLWEVHFDSVCATGCFKSLTAWILQHVFNLWSIQKNIYGFIKSVFMSAVHLMIKTRNSVTICTRFVAHVVIVSTPVQRIGILFFLDLTKHF